MALVSTMPAKGQTAKVYDIPDAELAKFKTLEATKSTYEEGKEKIASGKEMAGGVDLDKTDVQAYGDLCICYIWDGYQWWYRYQPCWASCP